MIIISDKVKSDVEMLLRFIDAKHNDFIKMESTIALFLHILEVEFPPDTSHKLMQKYEEMMEHCPSKFFNLSEFVPSSFFGLDSDRKKDRILMEMAETIYEIKRYLENGGEQLSFNFTGIK